VPEFVQEQEQEPVQGSSSPRAPRVRHLLALRELRLVLELMVPELARHCVHSRP
jgi:hypothetical protein